VTARPAQSVGELHDAAEGGDRTALARLLSLVERGGDEARAIGRIAAEHGGDAYTVGITGAPGAGKSTLASALIRHVRAGGGELAVLAIDPSSPFTGGAILGDRVRMQDHATDSGVFIRSMATRGHLGGLALATPEAVRLLASVGWRLIVIETVGVGQVEVEVAGKADTTIVVVNPGWGDSVQASKAGLLEVADVFVINKADRPGVDQTRLDLDQMLDLAAPDSWRPPIVATVATDGTGIDDVWAAVEEHRNAATDSGLLDRRRAARSREELGEVVARRLQQRAHELCGEERWRTLTEAVVAGEVDPWTAADELIGPVER
jgi:LAO/AO transport system kinase